MGISRIEQLEENIGAVGWRIPDDFAKRLDEAFPRK
jgi:aryl-alcohol dehydrogenase-like predicted oxidoreductase